MLIFAKNNEYTPIFGRMEEKMAKTEPIREKNDLKKFMNYYKEEHPCERNYAMIVLGLHTALRISDILQLQWKDVYNFKHNHFQTHIYVQEKKTKKRTKIALNKQVITALTTFKATRKIKPQDYIFTKNTCYSRPLSRSQAFRIVKKAADETLDIEHISCHSLRKTFGYQAWKQGTPPALLMDIYNHSSYHVTKKYLGIEQDERDALFLEMEM